MPYNTNSNKFKAENLVSVEQQNKTLLTFRPLEKSAGQSTLPLSPRLQNFNCFINALGMHSPKVK